MKPRTLLALAILLAFCSILAPASAGAHILRLVDGSFVPLEEMIRDLRTADFVFMGELHDREDHHRAQLQVLRSLHEAGESVAVGLEMIRREDQQALDAWVAGEMAEKEFLEVFQRNWSMWSKYREIFVFAREEGIPMVGLNVSREITQQVAQNGFSSLSAEQLGELPRVRCDVDEEYQDFIRRALGGHGHGGARFLHFCEAQMLWDTVMARELLDYHDRQPERTVVVLAGSGHAWRYGIPEQIARQGGSVSLRILLPEIPGRLEAGDVTVAEGDYLMLGLEEAPLH